jgi:hypothetical protein
LWSNKGEWEEEKVLSVYSGHAREAVALFDPPQLFSFTFQLTIFFDRLSLFPGYLRCVCGMVFGSQQVALTRLCNTMKVLGIMIHFKSQGH